MSFNLDIDLIDKLESMALSDAVNRSEWVNRLIWSEHAQRRTAEDVKKGLQTTLEIHTESAQHRAARADGKCNKGSINGVCKTCWGED